MNVHVTPLLGLSQRQPPANLEAEQALLGALLANGKAFERVSDFLRADHFADAVHARIFGLIQARHDAGRPADAVSLRQDFQGESVEITDADGKTRTVSGAEYLAQLLSCMVGIINAGEYGRVIRDAWLRRNVIDLGEAAVNLAYGAEPDASADQVLERVEAQLFALADGAQGQAAGGITGIGESVRMAMEMHAAAVRAKGNIVGVATGYRRLDRMTGGLRPGQFIVLGARPAMGKTSIGTGIAARAAAAGHRVLFVSAEMGDEEISARIVAAEAGLPLETMRRGAIVDPGTNEFRQLNDGECAELVRAAQRVSALPLSYYMRAAPPVSAIRGHARRMARRGGLDLVVIDYVGLLQATDQAKRQNSRNIEMTQISADLKAMAMELRVPIIGLSQLNRAVEARDDKRPILADLRDSGSLEQDADMVWFLHREHYYLKDHPPKRTEKEKAEAFEARMDAWHEACANAVGRGELIIAKQRNGPTGTVPLRFKDRLTWFFDESEPESGAAVPGIGGIDG